jgi:hypothetical protein
VRESATGPVTTCRRVTYPARNAPNCRCMGTGWGQRATAPYWMNAQYCDPLIERV